MGNNISHNARRGNNKYIMKNNWKVKLISNIEKIREEGIVQNIFMCRKNEYVNAQL
jgi:hypothetical protein